MINIKDICIAGDTSIINAMKILETSPQKIVLVVKAGRLVGTVTDGDIRRGLIRNISVNASVSVIMNAKPITFPIGTPPDILQKAFAEKKILQIPLLSLSGEPVSLVLSKEFLPSAEKDNTVILMAGGLGSRLGELTAECPKPMLKVGGRPILEIVLENLKEHGFSKFVLSVNYKAEMIEEHFRDGKDLGVKISYLREKERMGTAGSLSLYEPLDDQPLIVMNSDVLTKVNFSQFLDSHIKNNYNATMGVRQYDLQVPFGVVHVQDERIYQLEEKPTQSFFVNAGIYILNRDILSLIPKNTYFDMPTVFNLLISNDRNVGAFPIHEYWLDVGRKDDFNQAGIDFKKVF